MSTEITNEFSIVKLKKNGAIEYPITRPECVIYPNGETVHQKIEQLEDGASVVWQVYDGGNRKCYSGDALMFNKEESFQIYYSSMMNNVMRSCYSIEVVGSDNDWYDWCYTEGEQGTGNYMWVKNHQQDNDSDRVKFSMKHFASLMHGYAPNCVILGSEGGRKVYDRFVYLDSETLTKSEYDNKNYPIKYDIFGDNDKIRYVKLIMGTSNPSAYENYVDQIELSFFPCYENGITLSVNPLIVAYNNRN
jgi:hypothetical protein